MPSIGPYYEGGDNNLKLSDFLGYIKTGFLYIICTLNACLHIVGKQPEMTHKVFTLKQDLYILRKKQPCFLILPPTTQQPNILNGF